MVNWKLTSRGDRARTAPEVNWKFGYIFAGGPAPHAAGENFGVFFMLNKGGGYYFIEFCVSNTFSFAWDDSQFTTTICFSQGIIISIYQKPDFNLPRDFSIYPKRDFNLLALLGFPRIAEIHITKNIFNLPYFNFRWNFQCSDFQFTSEDFDFPC